DGEGAGTGGSGAVSGAFSGEADETAVLPPVRDAAPADVRGGDIADRVPPGFFRDERPTPPVRPDGSDDRTREL
ncbi:dTMP kinase, partial [Streptomyces sp. SID625]|nr:dTMP kinase [Streptomyces sp. SID625]